MKLRAGIPLRRKKMGNSTYKFYGWRTADVKDSLDLTPRDYYDLLAECWSADTCAPRMRMDWSLENRTLGQCSITAFLIQDIYGGKVYGVPLEDGNFHCFNDVDGCDAARCGAGEGSRDWAPPSPRWSAGSPQPPPGLWRGLASRGTSPPPPPGGPRRAPITLRPCQGLRLPPGRPRVPGEVPGTERAGGRAEEWAPWGFAALQETPAAQAALGQGR